MGDEQEVYAVMVGRHLLATAALIYGTGVALTYFITGPLCGGFVLRSLLVGLGWPILSLGELIGWKWMTNAVEWAAGEESI